MSVDPTGLAEIRRSWDEFGRRDPLWAILTDPARRGGRWDPEEFFATGRDDVRRLLEGITELGVPIPSGRALDFGCGVGRLTQALADHVSEVDGVDIAASMVAAANAANLHPDRCRYHVNTADDLGLFADATFDLVLTIIVLQHMEPAYSTRYIAEFVRVLRPGGFAIFQLPAAVRPEALPVRLSPGAHRAAVDIVQAPRRLAPGAPTTVSVRVRNASGDAWPARARVALGNHWLSPSGAVLQADDGRVAVGPLEPQATTELDLTIVAPTRPGPYLLDLDLVEEGVRWFESTTSSTNRVPVDVADVGTPWRRLVERLRRPAPTEEPAPLRSPVMAMHCVPQERVREVVAAAGGWIALVKESGACGPDYENYTYYVTTRPGHLTPAAPVVTNPSNGPA